MVTVVDTANQSGGGGGGYRRRAYRRRSYRRPSYRRRRTYRRRRSYRRKRLSAIGLHMMPKFLRAQINPFDASVIGVKIPDSNTYPSFTAKAEDNWGSLVADANGLKAMAFIPTLKNNCIVHTAAGASSWTWSAAYGGGFDSSRQTAIAANSSLCRTVAHGLRISCPAAPTAVTGNLHVAIYASSDFGKTTWNFPVNIAQLSNAMFYRKYPLAMFTQQSLTVVNKFLDCTSSKYIDPGSDGIDNSSDIGFQTNGWAAIIICVEGAAAATSVLTVDEIMHLECTSSVGGVDNASPAAPFNVRVQETVSHMAGNTAAAYTDQEEQSYLQEVVAAVSQGVSDYGDSIMSNVVVPGARHAAYGALSYAYNRAFGIPGVTSFRNPSSFQTSLLH